MPSSVLEAPGADRQKRMNLTLEAVELAPSFVGSQGKHVQMMQHRFPQFTTLSIFIILRFGYT